jgi:hypothetical protein
MASTAWMRAALFFFKTCTPLDTISTQWCHINTRSIPPTVTMHTYCLLL